MEMYLNNRGYDMCDRYDNDNTDMISVIVPIYNVEQYLQRCVDSIIKQTYTNLEIILVDDESPDHCGEICDYYAHKDGRIKVIHQKNKGLSGARNAGIEIAKGRYIAFVDSDDYIEPNMYEVLYNDIKKYNAGLSICNRYYEFEDGRRVERYRQNGETNVYSGKEAIIEMNNYSSFDMSAWDKLYKRELFEKIRFPEGKLSEDFFVMYKLLDMAQIVTFNPTHLYIYVQRNNSISRNKKINWDFIEASKDQMDYIIEKYPEIEDIARTAYSSANMTVYNFHLKNHVKCEKQKRKELQNIVNDNLDYVLNNYRLAKIKKLQAWLFVHNIIAYNILFISLRKIKKV